MTDMHLADPILSAPEVFEPWFELGAVQPLTTNAGVQDMSTHYDILGVSSDATPAQIRTAYKKGALKWHPDKWMLAPEAQRQAAAQRFQSLGVAYEVLSDPGQRKAYDRQQAPPPSTATAMSMEQAFKVFTRVVLESAVVEWQFSTDTMPAVLKLVASLGLPAVGAYFGGQHGMNASNAMSMLLVNPNGFSSVWESMSQESQREFAAAVLRLAHAENT